MNRQEKHRLIFFLGFLLLGAFFLVEVPRISLPMSVAYICSLVLFPLVPKIMKFGLNRSGSVCMILLVFMFFIIYPIIRVSPLLANEVQKFQRSFPKMERFVLGKYQEFDAQVKDRIGVNIGDQFIHDSISYVKKMTKGFLLKIPNLLASIFEWAFLMLFFLFFFLRDAQHFKRFFFKLCPNFLFERMYYLLHEFNRKLGNYIFAKTLEAALVGVAITLGLVIFEVRFSLLLGILAGVTNVIPYLGPFLGLAPALAVVGAEHGLGPTFGLILALYAVVNLVDITIIFPILVSKIVDLHPLLVVASVVLGSQYFGITGMVVSIPVSASVKLLFEEVQKGLYPSKIS